MNSPSSTVRVKVDGHGRLVLPLWLRREIVSTPGEVLMRRTPDGVLLTSVSSPGEVEEAPDGLPVLRLGRAVTNDEVIAAIDRERASR
jgi:bifunctional DNA-binding transcriptional regulator/antitoxin component of YhaV-PrlF toxin-antitoxin module